MEMKESNTVSSFNVIETAQSCSIYFHERICVREKSHECAYYNEAFAHLYIMKSFMLERNSMNVSYVTKHLCYVIH